jgi:hypothetical protein
MRFIQCSIADDALLKLNRHYSPMLHDVLITDLSFMRTIELTSLSGEALIEIIKKCKPQLKKL